MTKAMRISLKAGEKIYLNGAVFCADRKVTLELLNDAVFLLEGHVMQLENTTTPLRQLYFIVQSVLMSPANATEAQRLAAGHLAAVMNAYSNPEMLAQLQQVQALLAEERSFDVLRLLRQLFPLEDAIIEGATPPQYEVA